MEKELLKVFHKARYEQNSDLAQNIWRNIVLRDKRIARTKLWISSFVGLISLVGIVPMWKILATDLAHSGIYEYFSLAFSSNNSIFSYGKELTLSIAESLPIMSIVFSLSLVFILFFSFKYAAKQIIKDQLILSF